jgi:SAM-dependent methyltransferase
MEAMREIKEINILKKLNLKLAGDGIWYSADHDFISYPSEGNDICFAIEDSSFWFRHRNACIVEVVRNFSPSEMGPIVDVGGGNGFVAKALMDAGWQVVLVEPGAPGARNAKKRGLDHIVCGTTHSAGFENASLPAIGVFDVVEHIDNDINFLSHLSDLLEPGGMLYLTVPAYRILWSHEDVAAGHFRRYTVSQMRKKLEMSGFEVEFGSYIFRWLPIAVFFFRTIPWWLGLRTEKGLERAKKDHAANAAGLPSLLKFALMNEVDMLKKKRTLCFGGSCLIAARKKK